MGSLAEGIAERAAIKAEKRGERRGEKRGVNQGQDIMLKALEMLKSNVPLEKICRDTGCTMDRLSKLRALTSQV